MIQNLTFSPAVISESLPRSYYEDAVSEHFIWLRGSPFFCVGPADFNLIRRWRREGIPMAVVLRGLDSAFKKHRARRLRAEQINSLAYCWPQVLEEWKKVRV